jgi:hypothetical protein
MNIRSGTIICAQVKHPSGRGRDIERFYLVISETAENLPGRSMFCVGISKQCPDPPPPHAILLPFDADPRRRPMTGLRRRCACFVDWTVEIFPADVRNSHVGHVSNALFRKIMDVYEAFNS